MKVNNKELAAALRAAAPGLANKEIWPQATMFALCDGNVYTFNDEIAVCSPCAAIAGMNGAVDAKILPYLEALAAQDVTLTVTDGTLRVKAKKSSAGFPFDDKVELPIPEARPEELEFAELPENFSDMLSFVSSACCRTIARSPVLNCVHFDGDIVEACDNSMAIRYYVNTPLVGALIPYANIKAVLKLKPTAALYADEWAHFRCGSAYVSSRALPLDNRGYPNIDGLFEDDSSVLYDIKFADDVVQQLAPLAVLGEDVCDVIVAGGQAAFLVKTPESFVRVTVSVDNKEADVAFATWTKTMLSTLKNTKECSVSDNFLRFYAEDYTHVVARRADSE